MQAYVRPGSSEYLKLLRYRRFHYRWWFNLSPNRLLLLHGRGESADTWTGFASHLGPDAELIAMDLRGHGGTPWDPDRKYGFADLLDDLRIQLEHWARPTVLVGHGLGARLAAAAARELPGLVRALVIIEIDQPDDAGPTLVEQLAAAFDDDTDPPPGGPLAGPIWSEIYRALSWARPGAGRRPRCDPALLGPAGVSTAPSDPPAIAQPLLVLHGAGAAQPSQPPAQRVAESRPHVEHRTIDGGRWPHIDAPAETASAVRAWLATLPPTAPSPGDADF